MVHRGASPSRESLPDHDDPGRQPRTAVLMRASELEGIAAGRITLAFRRWTRPTVRAGGTLRTAAGVLAIDAVDVVDPAAITDDEARHAGFAGRGALLVFLDERAGGSVYRISLRLAGPDPRAALREAEPGPGEIEEILQTLRAMDARSRSGPWTMRTLRTIAARPGVRAADLAAEAGLETLPFKRSVRRLKEMGLTESLEVGYRVSPRGPCSTPRRLRRTPGSVAACA